MSGALAAAQRSDKPPLRLAQVAFVGPLAGAVLIRAQRLRRGRNAAWVQADVESEAGPGLRATFVFMREQASRLDHVTGIAPDFPPPEPPRRGRRARRVAALDSAVELMTVANGLPPAALKLIGGHPPLSSMTWQIDLLGTPATEDGWWLLRADTDYARGGASSQRMRLWNRAGVTAAQRMRSVAVFARASTSCDTFAGG